jgi:transposase InsO family protein
VLSDEKANTAVGFLGRAVRYFRRHAIKVQRVLTDNGAPYRAHTHRLACQRLGLKHLFTRPYRPRTNGKACVLAWRGRPAGRRGSPRLSV